MSTKSRWTLGFVIVVGACLLLLALCSRSHPPQQVTSVPVTPGDTVTPPQPDTTKQPSSPETAQGAHRTGPQSQTITFRQPSSPKTAGLVFTVAPTASSGLPVTLTGTGCRVEGFKVTMKRDPQPLGIHLRDTPPCVLTASQPGDSSFLPAADVIRTVEVAR